jgi:tetratricopeptide (TPR) repeat protein
MTAQTGQIVRGVFIMAFAVLLLGGFVVFTVRRAEDPARMVFKWILTFFVVAAMVWKVAPIVGQGGYGAAFVGIPLTAVCGLFLAIIWRYNLASLIASPFASLYDGGNVPPEPRPAYSVAQSNQKKGKYLEAISEIRKQLERFPTDFEGHMLLAQIQAEDLKDLPGAELTIQSLCAQPGHAPRNITFALFSLADWHLRFGPDREAARCALEKVIELLPESEFALTAAQRIAHLGNAEMLLAPNERKKFTVSEGVQNVGLAKDLAPVRAAEQEPGQVAAEYVRHLEQHPLDMEAREKLAAIYADHYGRLDLAADQLEQMIQQPNQPTRLVVRWLNLLADLQIRCGADYDTVRGTLQRIIDRDPNFAAAENARKRINLIKLEMKGKQKPNQAVKLGSYEQNIGLKRERGAGPPPV